MRGSAAKGHAERGAGRAHPNRKEVTNLGDQKGKKNAASQSPSKYKFSFS